MINNIEVMIISIEKQHSIMVMINRTRIKEKAQINKKKVNFKESFITDKLSAPIRHSLTFIVRNDMNMIRAHKSKHCI